MVWKFTGAKQSQLLLNCNEIEYFYVAVKAHKTLYTCRGAMSEPDI